MKQDREVRPRSASGVPVLLATDSADPSGVGHHMLTLAAHLSPAFSPTLAFQAGPAASAFVTRARAMGLAARSVDVEKEGWGAVLAGRPSLLHVHAGIGWEGIELVCAGRAAGWRVIRTEHLPYLLTDARQRHDHAAMMADLDTLIAVSPSAAASWTAGLARSGAAPGVRVIRNGIGPPVPRHDRAWMRAALGVPEGSTLILHVGRFTPQKGHGTLVEAFAGVAAARPGTKLMMVGRGETQAAVLQRIAGAALPGVTVDDMRDDVPDLMAAADMLVLPSLFEGLPLVVLEAMAAGLPVVATRVPGITDALGHGYPFLVPPGDAGALAAMLIARIDDPGGARAEGVRQRTRFDAGFTASRMTADTEKVYHASGSAQALQKRKSTMQMSVDHASGSHDTARQTVTRVGFIGAGGIAHRHMEVLARMADVAVAAVTDADAARAAEAAERSGAVAYDGVEAMLAGGALDALFICVPPFAHGPAERAAIRAGVPFFVEKPLTADLALAEALAAEVAQAGLVTAVGYHWRYLDTVDKARRALAGRPAQMIVGHWHDSTPPPGWWGVEAQSGGQMVEQVTHLIDTARVLAGGIASVHAAGNHLARDRYPGLDVATASVATLTFESGAVATFSATCLLEWNHGNGLRVLAQGMAIELSDREVMIDTGQGRHPQGAEGDPVWREDRDFIDAVRGGANRIRTTYADALETHRAALAIAASMRTGEVVHLTPADAAPLPPGAQLRREPARHDQHRRIRSLGVEAPHRAGFFDYDEGPAGDGQVRIDTTYTGLSAGTELTFLKATNPYLSSSWDAQAGLFREGHPSMHFPVPFLGYMEVGRVIDARAQGFEAGQMVAGAWGHKTGHTGDAGRDLLVAMPEALDPVLGVFVGQMGPIAANGILHADWVAHGRNPVAFGAGVAGRRVLVWGGGTVGLMTALFARMAGAETVVLVEPSPFRRHVAEKLGLATETEEDAVGLAKSWGPDGDRGADLVFQTRAHGWSLHRALQALRPQGAVIDLAFYQGGMPEIRLGEEFHHNGLSLVCAQINRVPPGLGEAWTRARLSEETLRLLAADGPLMRRAMITHLVPFDEGPAFLHHLIADRPEFLQVVFEVPS